VTLSCAKQQKDKNRLMVSKENFLFIRAILVGKVKAYQKVVN
jgi:hypothetical protein